MDYYSPAEAATRSGLSLDTLRYYERSGLLIHEIRRTTGGRRRYAETDVLWLRMLRCLRETGMPITEILRFTQLVRAGQDTVPERLALLEEHDRRIDEQIARWRERQDQVRWKIGYYRSEPRRNVPWRTTPQAAADPDR